MKKGTYFITLLAISVAVISGCSKKEGNLIVDIEGLPNLGPNFAYEGWFTGSGSAKTAGIFMVDDSGRMSTNTFEVKEKDMKNAKER